MRICEEYGQVLELIYLYKVLYDHGKKELLDPVRIFDDYYCDIIYSTIFDVAEITDNSERVYTRHGYSQGDDDVNVVSYSSKAMRDYFKIARKLHRLHGGGRDNPYIQRVVDRANGLLNFNSYCFDWLFVNKRKAASLDVLWSYEFSLELWLIVWVVRVMDMFKEELADIKAEYRKARREKRCRPKGGVVNAMQG